jgi:hypothetical protein
MTTPATEDEPIPVPGDFPITWDPPEHQQLFWFWDQMHHPHAVTPLTAAVDGTAFSLGIGKAAAALSIPVKRFHSQVFNYYFYYCNEAFTDTPEEAEARRGRMEAEMMRRAPRVLEDWETIYLPEVMTLNARLRDYPYAEASTRDVAAFLDEMMAIRVRQWELHFLAVMPVMGATMLFAELYEETFGYPENNEHYQMLQGFPNKSVEAGQALFDLAAELRSLDGVAPTLLGTPADRVLSVLEGSVAGSVALSRLHAYLDEYGWRSDQFELADPSWREDPRPAIQNLRAYLRDGAVDPRDEYAKAVRERERLVAEMFARAPDQATRNQFQMYLPIAQQYLPIQENHNFYIDQMNTVLLRLPVLEMGRRLSAEGALREPDHAFYLTPAEMQEAAARPDASWGTLATRRRAERERWSRVVPPSYLGTRRPPPPGREGAVDRFFGLGREPSQEPKVITGHGASKGTVTAPAKVVLSLGEADKLEQGDVLVCEMTMPPWTPLFSVAAAVVADGRGALALRHRGARVRHPVRRGDRQRHAPHQGRPAADGGRRAGRRADRGVRARHDGPWRPVTTRSSRGGYRAAGSCCSFTASAPPGEMNPAPACIVLASSPPAPASMTALKMPALAPFISCSLLALVQLTERSIQVRVSWKRGIT